MTQTVRPIKKVEKFRGAMLEALAAVTAFGSLAVFCTGMLS